MNASIEYMRQLTKPQLALSLAALVREIKCPGDTWTLEKGKECVEVLAFAASLAFPTRADIDSLGKNNTISDVAVKLADDIKVMKEEAAHAKEEQI